MFPVMRDLAAEPRWEAFRSENRTERQIQRIRVRADSRRGEVSEG